MTTCPNGHHNPKNQQLCEICDALIVPAKERSLSERAWWAIAAGSIVAAVILAAVLVGVVTHRGTPENSSAPTTTAEDTAMKEWWSAAQNHFQDFQSAVDDTRKGLANQDEGMLRRSCQTMHDAGAVDLRAHLPAPNPDLTAEIDAAISDAHDASHMCLAAISGSLNNYSGEFEADLDQAEKHLEAALAIINKNRLTA